MSIELSLSDMLEGLPEDAKQAILSKGDNTFSDNPDLIMFLEDALTTYTLQGGTDDTLTSLLSGFTSDIRNKPLRQTKYYQEIFFTRTMCRLSKHNLVRSRKLARLLNKNDGIEKYVRVALDARSGFNNPSQYTSEVFSSELRTYSSLLPYNSAFIPLLSNSVLKTSGTPDETVSNYVSKEGLRKEQVGWMEGDDRMLKSWDLDVTFANSTQEVLYLLLDVWKTYGAMLKRGEVYPSLDLQLSKKIDYTSGIYVFTLGEDRETITHSMQTRGYPYVLAKGKLFDIDKDVSAVRGGDNEIQTRFKCFGVDFDDQITFMDFNRVTIQINPELRESLRGNTGEYVYMPPSLAQLFKEVAIPWVDLTEAKLKWLVHKNDIMIVSNLLTDTSRRI